MPKDLLAFVDANSSDGIQNGFLSYAIALAESWGAHLTIAAVTAIPGLAVYPAPEAPNRTYAAMREEMLRQASERLARIEAIVAQHAASPSIIPLIEDVLLIGDHAATLARYADLVLIPPTCATASEWLRARITADVILGSGRPALLVPDSDRPRPWSKVVLAWIDTRECSSVWHDAATLLPSAARVEIIVGCPMLAAADLQGRPGARIVAHVRRQGFEAEVQEVSIHPAGLERQDPAEVLVRFARAQEADLLVLDAGMPDPSARNMLGRMARDVIAMADMPVFLSM